SCVCACGSGTIMHLQRCRGPSIYRPGKEQGFVRQQICCAVQTIWVAATACSGRCCCNGARHCCSAVSQSGSWMFQSCCSRAQLRRELSGRSAAVGYCFEVIGSIVASRQSCWRRCSAIELANPYQEVS